MAKEKPFHLEAVSAFEKTFRVLFEQAHDEAARVQRTSHAKNLLESILLDPERIPEMEREQQLALLQHLAQSQDTSVRTLMNLGKMFMDIRTVVGLVDSVKNFTSLPGSVDGEFPGLENHVDYDGYDD